MGMRSAECRARRGLCSGGSAGASAPSDARSEGAVATVRSWECGVRSAEPGGISAGLAWEVVQKRQRPGRQLPPTHTFRPTTISR